MSVVIVGGHDRMVSQYKKFCKDFKCKAMVFTQMSSLWTRLEKDAMRHCWRLWSR